MTTSTPTPTTKLAIHTTGLTKSYPDAAGNAVSALDLSIPQGCVYGLLGRNGAGKTTTIRMLTTLLPPTSGHAEILGIPLHDSRRIRPRIGVALQEVALDLWLTPLEQLELGLTVAGWSRRERKARVAALVDQFGLNSFHGKRIGTLSGGMRRRVDVAMAVSHDPDLLFLDEPTSGLDIEGKEEVWNVVSSLRRDGRTVVLTTHDMEEAVTLADRIGIINDGALISSGPAAELTAGRGTRAHITTSGHAPLDAAVQALRSEGFVVLDHQPDARAIDVEVDGDRAEAASINALTSALTRNGHGEARIELRSASLRDAFLETTR